jgi:hypothetical protein
MEINQYIATHLRPTANEEGALQSNLNGITQILQNDPHLSVAKCLPGGSFAKGTMVRGNFEADIVYIFNKKKQAESESVRNYVFKLMKGNFPDAVEVRMKSKAIQLTLQKPIGRLCFDILPSYDINSPLQLSQVPNLTDHSAASTQFQVEYIKLQKSKMPYFGDLIRVLKYWRDHYKVPLSSYQLELVAAAALFGKPSQSWEEVLLACFYKMLEMIAGVAIVPVDWHYFKHPKIVFATKSESGILMVDPGNPANNVGASLRQTEIELIRTQTQAAIRMIHAQKKVGNLEVRETSLTQGSDAGKKTSGTVPKVQPHSAPKPKEVPSISVAHSKKDEKSLSFQKSKSATSGADSKNLSSQKSKSAASKRLKKNNFKERVEEDLSSPKSIYQYDDDYWDD